MAQAALNNNVRAGELRPGFKLFDMEGPRDEGRQKTEREVATVWARLAPMSGSTRYMVSQYAERTSHVITIRWRPGGRDLQKVLYDGREFSVVYALDPDERKEWLHLLVMEEVPA